MADGRSGVRDELKHEASDDRIEKLNICKGRDFGSMERHVIEAESRRTLPSGCEGGLVRIDGNDLALRPDELGYEHRHIADATTNIQYAHPRRNPGFTKELLR